MSEDFVVLGSGSSPATADESAISPKEQVVNATTDESGTFLTTHGGHPPATDAPSENQDKHRLKTPCSPPIRKRYGEAQDYIAPEEPPAETTVGHRVFLAGTIEMGSSPDWQYEATLALAHLPITLFNPRRTDWDSSWDQRASHPQFLQQVVWELGLLESCEVVGMYLHPGTVSPISLLELGLYIRARAAGPLARPPATDLPRPADDPDNAAADLPRAQFDPADTQVPPRAQTVVVCCPDGFGRLGNVEVVCNRYGIVMVKTFQQFVDHVAELTAGKDAQKPGKVPDIDKWEVDPTVPREKGKPIQWRHRDTRKRVYPTPKPGQPKCAVEAEDSEAPVENHAEVSDSPVVPKRSEYPETVVPEGGLSPQVAAATNLAGVSNPLSREIWRTPE